MRKLSFIIGLIIFAFTGFAQSPHGEGFKTDCTICHTSESWKITRPDVTFDHNTTKFKLTGQHQIVDCKSCHQSLKFQEAKNECAACHTDMHQNTLGPDCEKCHDTKSWIVKNTSTLHQMSRFPLLGNHAVADCASCHKSSSNLQFEPLGIACIDCHRSDYMATQNPNHQTSNYSTDCNDCHGIKAVGWKSANFEHGFFPLNGGHQISCADCHSGNEYQKINKDCFSCHQKDYNATSKPNHQQTGFSTSCVDCHNTNPDWNPANFAQHDANYFPIYSGEHKGEWGKCTDCHTTNSYSTFSCTNCHEHSKSKMDDEHKGENGYSYESMSCYACHPQGNKSGTFNHNTTSFPLTGAHTTTECASCHTAGYAGTSNECNSCHQKNYTEAQTPSHTAAGISADCKICHTSTTWQPSNFKHSTTGFELTGGHAAIVQCSSCHLGNTTTAKSECISCHQVQYNTAKGHVESKFPTDCKMCHNSNNWLNATFDHNATSFPLTGVHTTTECASCHTAGYAGTSNECNSCHLTNYNQATNPNHATISLPVTCADCHTTNPDWQPASFSIHNNYYALTGTHAAIANDCASCHNGNYINTMNTCYGCHSTDYNMTSNPPHSSAQFPTDCTACHTSSAWAPSTFNHDTQYFPIYSGNHRGEWTKCSECHTSTTDYTAFSCIICHEHNNKTSVDNDHDEVNGYAYNSTSCFTCHPKGND